MSFTFLSRDTANDPIHLYEIFTTHPKFTVGLADGGYYMALIQVKLGVLQVIRFYFRVLRTVVESSLQGTDKVGSTIPTPNTLTLRPLGQTNSTPGPGGREGVPVKR